MTRRLLGLALLFASGIAAGGCATTRAQIPEQPPTLVVPPVPPRAIEPAPAPPPPAEPPVVESLPPPVVNNKPRPRPTVDTSKPDPKQEPPPDTVAVVPPPPPVPQLRTPTTPSGPEATRQIRDIIDTTQKLLDKLDYPNLSDDRKANYMSARAFIQQSEEALRKDELTQARSFAERAQTIAKVLLTGR
jgi:hypothetical protein